MRYDDEALFIEVRNRPGLPYEGQSTGQGLHGLTERVRLAGGVLSHSRLETGEFRLGAVLPYDAEIPDPTPVVTGDFRQEIRRTSRRQKIGLVGVGVTVLVAMSSCVASIVVVGVDEPVDQGAFRSMRKGDDMERLRHLLPDEPMSQRTKENGEICRTYSGDGLENTDDENTTINYELCFRDEILVSKRKVEEELFP